MPINGKYCSRFVWNLSMLYKKIIQGMVDM